MSNRTHSTKIVTTAKHPKMDVCPKSRSVGHQCTLTSWGGAQAGPQGAGSAKRPYHIGEGCSRPWDPYPFSCKARYGPTPQRITCCGCGAFEKTDVKYKYSTRTLFTRLFAAEWWMHKNWHHLIKSQHSCPRGCGVLGTYTGCAYSGGSHSFAHLYYKKKEE